MLFSDFAQFVREAPIGLAAFPDNNHLADVLVDVARLHNQWMCVGLGVGNADCDGAIIKI